MNTEPTEDELAILDAIYNKDIFFAIQPIIATKESPSSFYKYEILARLKINAKTISPDVFIPLAIRFGCYHKISETIIEKSFAYVSNHSEIEKFSININTLDIKRTTFQTKLDQELKKFPLQNKLIFELTEDQQLTFDTTTTEIVKQFMKKYTDIGCQFALDDFGKGYATFDPLLNLPFHYIKLDQVIIKKMKIPNNPSKDEQIEREKIYYTIDMLSHYSKRLGIQIVAEYVQENMIEIMKGLEVDFLQGYGIGEPIEIPDCP